MAFADLLLGTVVLPLYVYHLGDHYSMWTSSLYTSLYTSLLIPEMILKCKILSKVKKNYYSNGMQFKRKICNGITAIVPRTAKRNKYYKYIRPHFKQVPVAN